MPAPRLPPGTRIQDRYRLLRVIGEGGMGTVWAATDEIAGGEVALKVLRPDLAEDEDAPARFRREAYATSQVRHPAIVPLLDSGVTARGLPFLVYELVRGPSLKEELSRRGRLPPFEAVAIAIDVLGALGAAHAEGIVHRDVKPSNVLLLPCEPSGFAARVIDFGVAKSLSGGDGIPRVTSTGEIVGTAQYMSPEQAGGKGGLDARSDLWSVAAMLYEMLAGRPPYEARSATQTILKILSQEPPLLSSVATGIPDALVIAVHCGLARERERRWQGAIAFADALLRSVVAPDSSERTTMRGFRDPQAGDDQTATIRMGDRDDDESP